MSDLLELDDIRLAWVDNPKSDCFQSHRSLKRYALELHIITSAMREYSLSSKPVDQSVLWSIYDYGQKAFDVYATALHQWLEQNPGSLGRDSIHDLVTHYLDEEKKLKRYLKRALKPPEERSTASCLTSHSSHTSAVSAHSLAIIQDLRMENTLLKKEKKEMELTLEEKELDLKHRIVEQELHGKRNTWLKGPAFLSLPNLVSNIVDNFCSLDKPQRPMTACTYSLELDSVDQDNGGFLGHTLDRTRSLEKVVRVVTAVFKCVQKWKSHLRNYQEAATDLDPHQASLTLVRAAQRQSFGCVVDKMQSGVTYESAVKLFPVSKRERWMFSITKFVPFLDQYGILRMGGRLTECNELSDEQAHPAFLPKRHKITELFIIAHHNKLAHRAAETVLASLQNDAGLYPIGGIATVRHYLADCFNCKLLRKERACQLMAPLPEYRITPRQPVFSSVSIDYAGPYDVKRGRSTEKRWICLFVCNATSAVRVELVESLETTAFLNALRRFLCMTGNKTRHIRCDCATTFVGARNVLKTEAKSSGYSQDALSNNWMTKGLGITWDFSVPASSHHQGFVERQIRTFKEVTEAVIGPGYSKRTPSDFDLLTIMREAEFVMNCQPLGHYFGDEDTLQALRPLDLMTGFLVPVDEVAAQMESDPKDTLRRGHRYTRRIASEWWRQWVAKYLPRLQKRQKWTRAERNLQEGDFVLLLDDATPPKGRYPYAVVMATKTCSDGFVRSCTVKTSDGLIRDRDVRKIVLLEEAHPSSHDGISPSQNDDGPAGSSDDSNQLLNNFSFVEPDCAGSQDIQSSKDTDSDRLLNAHLVSSKPNRYPFPGSGVPTSDNIVPVSMQCQYVDDSKCLPNPPLVGQTFWRSNDAGAIASDDEPPMTSQSSLSPPLNPKPCSQLIPTKKLRFCSRLAAPFSKTAFPPTPDRCEDVNFLVHRRTLFVNSDDCSSLPRSPLLTSQKSTSLAD